MTKVINKLVLTIIAVYASFAAIGQSFSYIPVLGDTSGYTPGSFSVTDAGSAYYSIPLIICPGTNGVQPSLSINYNSQGGNSIVGQGWSLQGVSVISRTPQSLAQDGRAKGISYTFNDRFALDGERLVIKDTTSPYGADGIEYRTEQNNFSRVISYGNLGGRTPKYFEVRTKSGNRMEYGKTDNSRVKAGGATLFWLVNKISDTKGNYFTFQYLQDTVSGEYYPDRINYTYNDAAHMQAYASVRFEYEDRTDFSSKYLSGKKVFTSTKRLVAVKSYYGNTLVRAYYLSYQYSPSGISQLKSLKECGTDGHCHTPTVFTWANGDSLVFSPVDIASFQQYDTRDKVFSADLNNDGAQDIVNVPFATKIEPWQSNKNASAINFSKRLMSVPDSVAGRKFTMGDFNGDGKVDFLFYDSVTGNNSILYNIDSAGSTRMVTNRVFNPFPPSVFAKSGYNYKIVYPMDFNMDGRTDILTFDPITNDNYWLFTTTVGYTGFSLATNTATGNNYFTDLVPDRSYFNYATSYQPVMADFTGDGLVDILFWNAANGSTKLYKNNGGAVGSAVSFSDMGSLNGVAAADITNPAASLMNLDINGDGTQDILFYNKATGTNKWWLNKGDNSFNQVIPTSAIDEQIKDGTTFNPIDFNGDGYVDILWIDSATGVNRWLVNDGRCNFSNGHPASFDPSYFKGYNFQGLGNFTGRTNFDIFLLSFNNTTTKARILRGNLRYNNLVTKITAGNGQRYFINYDFLSNDTLYQKQNNAVYPLTDFTGAQYVVRSWQVDNGVGGLGSTTYKYKGAKLHVGGRGFRGFAQVDIKDDSTGIVTSKYFMSDNNSWKYVSSPQIKTTTTLPNGIAISKTDIVNALKDFNYGSAHCHYSSVRMNSSKTYEINGLFTDSTNTKYVYDDYGNVLSTVTNYGDGFIDSLVNRYQVEDIRNWLLGRLTKSVLYRMAPGKPTIVKSSFFTYDMASGSGLLNSETIEPDSSAKISITKTYTYDVFGNITSTSVKAWNGFAVETRTTYTTYDSLGRFPVTYKNAQGQSSSRISDPLLGHAVRETDINGLQTNMYFDGFGRPIKKVFADGTWETFDYRKYGGAIVDGPANSLSVIVSQTSHNPSISRYFDLYNRELRSKSIGFDGRIIFTDVEYNTKGQEIKKTYPYFTGDSIMSIYTFYDVIGRKTKVIEPGNRRDSVNYNGRTVTFFNALGQKKIVKKDAKEQMVRCGDHNGNFIIYDYDAAGRLLSTTDPQGNNISITYDILGNKTSIIDPDMGTYKYVTNGFGEIIKQTNPNNNIITIKYDSLGRMVLRTEQEGTTRWIYDTCAKGKGLLAAVVTNGGYTKTVTYNNYSRLVKETQKIDGLLYTQSNTYDAQGRIKNITYPNGLTVANIYNANGYLYQVKNAAPGGVTFWTATEINAKGQLERALYGNNTIIRKRYDAATNYLQGVSTTKGGTYLQRMSFNFDAIGNLLYRRDSLLNKEEDFEYDALNRLLKAHIIGGDSLVMAYDALGNILSKSDVGAYHYGGVNNGPHRLLSVDLLPGTCIPSLLINTEYNSFNKVKRISKDSSVMDILYNPDRQRNVQKLYVSGQLKRIKIYASGLFEREMKNGDTIGTCYISTPDGVIATYTSHTLLSQPYKTVYFHRDHLGTTVLVTSDTGRVLGRYSYDAWGKRRNGDWTNALTDTTGQYNDRGFTGHEHYDLFDIVDMNGRIYDPTLGRFLSPDPFIEDNTNLQCYNRYSYVRNNPLSLTDPSGYFSFGDIFKSIFSFVVSPYTLAANAVAHYASVSAKWVGENWRTLAVVAVGITAACLAGPLGAYFWGAVISGAAGGLASGVTASLLSGGNIGQALMAGLKGGAIGAVSGGLTYGVGDVWGHQTTNAFKVAGKVVTHGVVQGGVTVAQGGKFLNGFYSGVAATGGEHLSFKSQPYADVAVNAAISGTVSSLTGGSFANGAISGAYITMFNKFAANVSQNSCDKDDEDFTLVEPAKSEGEAQGWEWECAPDNPLTEKCWGGYDGVGGEVCIGVEGPSVHVGVGMQESMDGMKAGGSINIGFGKHTTVNFNINVIYGFSCKLTLPEMPAPPKQEYKGPIIMH